MGCILGGRALAADPVALRPALPDYARWGAELSLQSGVDVWTQGGGGAVELHGGVGAVRAAGPLNLVASYGGRVEQLVLPAGGLYQDHLAEASLGLQPRALLGAVVLGGRLSGAGSGLWGDAHGGARLGFHSARGGDTTLTLGLTHRQDSGASWTAPYAQVAGDVAIARRLQLAAWTEVQLWAPDGGLPVTFEGAARLLWSPSARVEGWLLGGGVASGGEDWMGGWAGVPIGGTAVPYLAFGVSHLIRRELAVFGEGRVETGLGSTVYGRGVAMVGVRAQVGRASVGRDTGMQQVVLTLDAPYAASVAVVGDFTGWQPREMIRGADGLWGMSLVLAQGTYLYTYVVDGEAVVPPECAMRRPDGFGGENGVLVVTGAK